MNSIAQALAEKLNICLNSRITSLQKKGTQWHLYEGESAISDAYDFVLLTMPAEQCHALVPEDSSIRNAIPTELHKKCWALGLASRGEVDPNIQGIFGDDLVSWASRETAKPGRSNVVAGVDEEDGEERWMLHFSPEWSARNETIDESNLVQEGLSWLQKYVSPKLSISNSYRHFWRYANIIAWDDSSEFLVDREQSLAVLGAWCCQGKVEGAFLSAEALLESDVFSGLR